MLLVANTVHIYKSKSGNWNVSFHHPICRDGSIGKKIHRSLKVSNEAEARVLQRQLDELLALAETPSLPTRGHAIAQQNYDRVVIDAFYDCITPQPLDYLGLRERAMPLPPKEGKRGPIPRVLVVGATAVGKSRFIQHILQTTTYNFPMRGAGRTTVADIEIIVDDVDFSAVITFFTENEVRETVKENILEACAFAHREKEDVVKIASKMLVDSDKRFRFNFVLGDWTQKAASTPGDDFELEGEEQEFDLETDATPAPVPWTKFEFCVAQVVSMTELAVEAARSDLEPVSEQDEPVIEELWLQYIDDDRLDALVEEILEELEKRLCAATGQTSWPAVHRIADSAEKAEFFRRLRPFYENNRKFFGALVTPLVQGIRVRGQFGPPLWAAAELPRWVLLDGQGVGHEQGGSTKINRTVPPELARKFSDADVICLVDRAVPSMTGDAPVLLENLITRGHQDHLAFIFTHFEDVSAPDLDGAARKAKVLEGLSNAIQGISSLPKAQRVILERTAESKSYFLARLDMPEIKLKPVREEMRRICDQFKRAGKITIPKIRPMFNEYQIARVLQTEIEAYRRDWSEPELRSYHWKIMEALTNWIGHAYADGYPKRNLYPGQNLSQRLISAVSVELESPTAWDPWPPENADDESRILNAIRSKVGDRIDTFCSQTLVGDPRTGYWLPAYENISGPGTKMMRARTIARILEDRAQLPSEGLGRFTKDIWQIVETTIAEVCSIEQEKESVGAV